MAERLPEEKERLLWIAAGPIVWTAHFLLSYASAAVYCAKYAAQDGSLRPVRLAIAGYTAIALAAIAAIGRRAWRRHTFEGSALPHDFDSPEDRHRFLGFAGVLLAGLSAVAVVYEALAAVFIETCR